MELSQREKVLILIALVTLTPLLVFQFFIKPMDEHRNKQSVRIASMEKKNDRINMLGQELIYLKKGNRTRSASLSRRIDSILRQNMLNSRSGTNVKGQSDAGQKLILKLDEINLTELTNVVFRIENAKPGIIIESIDIVPAYQNKRLFRVTYVLSSI